MTPALTIKDFRIPTPEVGAPMTLILEWSDGTEETLRIPLCVNVSELARDLLGSETTGETMVLLTRHGLRQIA